MTIIVVATNAEEKLAKKRFKHKIIIKTGVGGTNVIRKLKRVPKWIKIINFGYAGSNNIDVGTELEINECQLYHPNAKFGELIFTLKETNRAKVTCYTAGDFVTETNIKEPVVFDMELAYICALGFKRVRAIKIISDNLSMNQYEKEVNK